MSNFLIGRKLKSAAVAVVSFLCFGSAQASVIFQNVTATVGDETATLVFKETSELIPVGITFYIMYSGITLDSISLLPDDPSALILPIDNKVSIVLGDLPSTQGDGVYFIPTFSDPLEISFVFGIASALPGKYEVKVGCDPDLCDFGYEYMPIGTANISLEPKKPTGGQVPEPGTLAMLGLGLMGLAISRRRARMH